MPTTRPHGGCRCHEGVARREGTRQRRRNMDPLLSLLARSVLARIWGTGPRPSQAAYALETPMAPSLPPPPPPAPTASVLLVDDHPPNLFALEAVLEPLGARLVRASSGTEALECLLREDFAVIVLDVQMPGLDGFETAALIRQRERTREVPILFVTAIHRDEAHEARGYAHGAVDYLAKPFNPDVLRAKVAALVALWQHVEALRLGEAQLRAREQAAQEARVGVLAGRLRESELNLRQVGEAAGAGTFEVEFATGRVTADEQWRVLFFLPQEAPLLLGEMLLRIHPEDRERTAAAIEAARTGGSEGFFLEEHRTVSPEDGRARWVEARARTTGAGGRALRMLGTAVDITARKRAERERERLLLEVEGARAEAEAARAHLHDLFMQTPLPIAVLEGPSLRFVVANAAYCEVVGRQGLVGRDYLDVFPELVGRPVADMFRDVYERGETARFTEREVRLVRNGVTASCFFNYVLQPMRKGGAIIGLMVVGTDVTAQVTARRRVDGLRAAAEEASRAKDEFLNTLSHELRTPLTAIIGWSSMLRSGNVPAEQQAAALETVERNARIQARLIEDMLDLSRIEQGKFVLSVGPVEMVRVVEAAIEAVRPAAEARGIRLEPELDSHATIVGDADRLQQVAWNLLSNAIKFTPKGGRVQVRLRREPSHVELVVSDTGQGIAADFLPHVFDRFRQGDASFTRKTGGLGLGLAIVRSLVELHGGDVRAESDGPGVGATFTVRLPLAPPRADRSSPAAPEPHPPHGVSFDCPAALRGKRVLLVDDEVETRELVRFVLSQCECQVETAGGGTEALRVLERGTFDVLISDIGMPDMDGFELIRRVRAQPASAHANVPALALTAYARDADRARALREGFDMHLAKPVEPGELLAILGTLLSDRLA